MGDNRFQKAIFCSELEEGTRSHGGQQKRYKDTLKANLKHCDIATPELEELALDRSDWRRSHCKTSIQQFEAGRVWTLETNDNTNLLHMDQPCGNSRRQGFILVRCQLPPWRLQTFLCVEDRAICTSSHSATNLSLLWSEIRQVDGSVHQWSVAVSLVQHTRPKK